jgi:hypothetical protein
LKKKILFINLLILTALLGCSFTDSFREWIDGLPEENTTPEVQNETTEPDTSALTWQENIDDLQTLFSSLSLPDHFMEENPTFMGGEFDVMAVFSILDHIWMADGYRLAYVYQYDFMGGHPILYAYQTDDSPYISYQEYMAERGECIQGDSGGLNCNYLSHVQTDGSELGYLQLLLLDVMGNQFYLFWHAEYNDTTFIATEEALDQVIENIADPFISLTREQQAKARRIDPSPKVQIDEDSVSVQAVWFTKWGGFYESSYLIDLSSPDVISDSLTKNLVEYDCGLMF